MRYFPNTEPFSALKPFFIPAIYHRVVRGSKKIYQLSISFEGKEIIIKRASKKFVHSGFNKVITGAVMRMRKLFGSDKLTLEVVFYSKPTISNLGISFELINREKFKIGSEEYFASILVEYHYDKMGVVTYSPIIYREVCTNGMVAVMTKNFSEAVAADRIFEIGCEWTHCNFESYQNKLRDYFEILKETELSTSSQRGGSVRETALRKLERVLNINSNSESEMNMNDQIGSQSPQHILDKNIKELGSNEFAVWNAITEYASREPNLIERSRMFRNAGKYLSDEMEKILRKEQDKWSESLYWGEVEAMSN